MLPRRNIAFGPSLAALSLLSGGCGSLSISTSAKLTIGMIGVFSAPATATGNNLPRTETFTMVSALIKTSDGQEVGAYTGKALDFVIINRPQIVLEYNLTELIGKTVNSIEVQFGADVTAAGKYNSGMTATLADAKTAYTVPFEVAKSKGYRLNINVNWQNTVHRDDTAKTETLEAPQLETVLGDGDS